MDSVKIVHISDLHISEHILRDPSQSFKLPHRYGHDVQAFLSLDNYLKNSEWDLLVITGDVTRIGNVESFENVRNWLEGQLLLGGHQIGLKLNDIEDRDYVIIPGNHDRFNGKLTQGGLDNYHSQFNPIRSGSNKSFYFGKHRINVHLYDSTESNGSFAYGYLSPSDMVSKNLDENINIALLHHHFIQPPEHAREAATELTNSADVSAYILNSEFDGVFFGHTHQGYIGNPKIATLKSVLPDKRKKNRFWNRIAPKFLLRKMDGDCLVSYKRDKAKNGQLPTLESYFSYLYMRKNNVDVLGPNSFDNIKDFYAHIDSIAARREFESALQRLGDKNILISLAPSACQEEAEYKGFHEVIFTKEQSGKYTPTWRELRYNGNSFEQK
ncbi:metallophosphoesterase family protein [Vibrio parahaemolyticus]|uniref:metallophosphoesterase family protein n=1 Tax=Vibrio parahaemolyticus TaxID=670 RepID=UPI00084AFD04|nr:metallophosphoesterase [Vibrio parahaemolyticus]ODY27630.1 hypothetical protein BBM18_03215 [Vibrio parahaemolyticus]